MCRWILFPNLPISALKHFADPRLSPDKQLKKLKPKDLQNRSIRFEVKSNEMKNLNQNVIRASGILDFTT